MSTRKITKVMRIEPEDADIVPINEELPLKLAKTMVIEKELELIVEGLMTDGEHHKQWYLEQVLLSLLGEEGVKNKRLEVLEKYEWAWEHGILP